MQRALVIRDRTFNQSDIVLDTEQLNKLLAKGWKVVSHCPLGKTVRTGAEAEAPSAVGTLVIIEKPDDELDEDMEDQPGLVSVEELDQEKIEELARELGKQLGEGLGKEVDGEPGGEDEEDQPTF